MDNRLSEQDSSMLDNDNLSRLKRTACGLCRKRKLKCDGTRPMCATCSRLGHDCVYEEQRKKSGPKRGYVKALEARLAQVESQLKNKDGDADPTFMDGLPDDMYDMANTRFPSPPSIKHGIPPTPDLSATAPYLAGPAPLPNHVQNSGGSPDDIGGGWGMLPTGLQEQLPPPNVVNDLNDLYFTKVHVYVPFLHRARFLMAMGMAPNLQPPVSLRYSMWALAAETSDKYSAMADVCYRRSRKYLELDEMRSFGEPTVSVAHCQAWTLCSLYEFKNMMFPRAWMSAGRAVRLSQMLGLHRIDGSGGECKETLPPPRDWVEKEERRRTFWMTFWEDRCASIGTGWPMSVEEQDIKTNLPASDEAFQSGRPQPTQSLVEALHSYGSELSGFAGAILLAAMLGRNLEHMHRTYGDDNEGDLNGRYWTRHREIDNILLNITMTLPDALRIPTGLPDPNVIFMNMCIHTSVICLHQAGMSRAEKNSLAGQIGTESKMRCITAASEIATIMRAIAHLDLSKMNPFMSFCLYVAARVFIQYLKARRNDARFQSSLQFILSAMHAMKKRNALNEAFLAQLDVEMEACGIARPEFKPTPGNLLSQIKVPGKYAVTNSRQPVGLASAIEIQRCDIGFMPGNVEEVTDSPAGGSSSNGSEHNSQAPRQPSIVKPFDYRIPETNIGFDGYGSPQMMDTPGSTSNSDSAPLDKSRTQSYSNATQPVQETGSMFEFPSLSMSTSSGGNYQPQVLFSGSSSSGPGLSAWMSPQVTLMPEMAEMPYDLPTPSEYGGLGVHTKTPAPETSFPLHGDASNQFTIPVRPTDSSADNTATPGSWNIGGNSSGMTPNFNMATPGDWDNLMEGMTGNVWGNPSNADFQLMSEFDKFDTDAS